MPTDLTDKQVSFIERFLGVRLPSGIVADPVKPHQDATDEAEQGVDISKRQFLITRWQRIPGDLDSALGTLSAAVAAKVPDEDPDDLCDGVRRYFKELLGRLLDALQDAVDTSISKGDQKYSAVSSKVENLLGQVSKDPVLAELRRGALTAGEPFETAITAALREIDRELTR